VNLGIHCVGWPPDVVKPGIHRARTHWIRGSWRSTGSGAGSEGGPGAGLPGREAGDERGRGGGCAYGMMWEKGGVLGLGVI
jgi:hypothetical protein